MAGNPNPSPETRFKPGNNANPGGKTSEQRRLEIEAAEMAARIRHAQLSAMTEIISAGGNALQLLTSDALRLFKDSEDRAHGTPKSTVAGPGESGEHLHKVSADDAFATFRRYLAGHAAGPTSGDHGAGEVAGDGAT